MARRLHPTPTSTVFIPSTFGFCTANVYTMLLFILRFFFRPNRSSFIQSCGLTCPALPSAERFRYVCCTTDHSSRHHLSVEFQPNSNPSTNSITFINQLLTVSWARVIPLPLSIHFHSHAAIPTFTHPYQLPIRSSRHVCKP